MDRARLIFTCQTSNCFDGGLNGASITFSAIDRLGGCIATVLGLVMRHLIRHIHTPDEKLSYENSHRHKSRFA